jgi:acetolactate synthase-1/2/3 large subunit
MKYSDQVVDWLVEEGYTHCFFVAGGNIMHLLDSARTRVTCVPFVHEGAAAVAAEYFTETSEPGGGKAFVMVTAGPGITNALTGIAGAWLDSRELLVIGGQVKRSDLSNGEVRQRGIQEVDGLAVTASLCKRVLRVEVPEDRATIVAAIRDGATPRKGPVFIEMCLDAQAASPVDDARAIRPSEPPALERVAEDGVARAVALAAAAERPVILLGGGVTRKTARAFAGRLAEVGIPVMLTWNAAANRPPRLRRPTQHLGPEVRERRLPAGGSRGRHRNPARDAADRVCLGGVRPTRHGRTGGHRRRRTRQRPSRHRRRSSRGRQRVPY